MLKVGEQYHVVIVDEVNSYIRTPSIGRYTRYSEMQLSVTKWNQWGMARSTIREHCPAEQPQICTQGQKRNFELLLTTGLHSMDIK